MDLEGLVRKLCLAHNGLEGEVADLDREISYAQDLTRKYGDHWSAVLQHLCSLRAEKCTAIAEVGELIRAYHRHLDAARALCQELSRKREIRVGAVDGSQPHGTDFVVSVLSPILANSRSPEQAPTSFVDIPPEVHPLPRPAAGRPVHAPTSYSRTAAAQPRR
eukprot:RCo048253